jgi:hypothetical protein
LDNALAAGEIDFISESAEVSIVRPVVPIVAVDPVPEAMLEAMPEVEVSAAVDVVTPDSDETGEVAVVVDAVAAPAVPADVSGETVCALEPAEVPATWAIAAACPAGPVSEVVGGGQANGDNADAAADDPA